MKIIWNGAKKDYRIDRDKAGIMADILHEKLEKGSNNLNRSERKILAKIEKHIQKQGQHNDQ